MGSEGFSRGQCGTTRIKSDAKKSISGVVVSHLSRMRRMRDKDSTSFSGAIPTAGGSSWASIFFFSLYGFDRVFFSRTNLAIYLTLYSIFNGIS